MVSPTVAAMKRARLDKLKGGRLVVAGEQDRMAPADELISLAVASQGVECCMIARADHTWSGHESQSWPARWPTSSPARCVKLCPEKRGAADCQRQGRLSIMVVDREGS